MGVSVGELTVALAAFKKEQAETCRKECAACLQSLKELVAKECGNQLQEATKKVALCTESIDEGLMKVEGCMMGVKDSVQKSTKDCSKSVVDTVIHAATVEVFSLEVPGGKVYHTTREGLLSPLVPPSSLVGNAVLRHLVVLGSDSPELGVRSIKVKQMTLRER
ncbi:hypothetical protein LSTR_LSTR016122 [Laodelphax striatellus]|uniref:Uncharacterized protein n=1 Tax=Laodelphax striatellus TaxID=195883 RepID=A0A482WUH2_LAOST|nr:hypothetical protein LSTR_LSTR016122 [Laodelphax striatellus]